jgi:hypothetical protein
MTRKALDASSSIESIAPLATSLNPDSDKEREMISGLGELRTVEKVGRSGRTTSIGGKMSSMSKRRSALGKAKRKPVEENKVEMV